MRDYWPYPHGLVQLVEPNSKWIGMLDYAKDNEQLLKQYRRPASASVRMDTFEYAILFNYSLGSWQVGTNFERAGSKTEAQAWYQRAREIDPHSEGMYRALLEDSARVQALYRGGF